ncbi:hypothetical protein MUK42_32528 [Musa troglodytarum]|uniref:Uncharacterized protein n=1 Tax=Musa troglodytarum TaxID=320322 RepID=A0A9E7LB45_9LILI|nr:hypothetical protein MUK42_32528 [Musa troglodytarum]
MSRAIFRPPFDLLGSARDLVVRVRLQIRCGSLKRFEYSSGDSLPRKGDMNVYLRAFFRCQSLTWRQAAWCCSYGSHAGNFAVRMAFVSQLRVIDMHDGTKISNPSHHLDPSNDL